MKKFITLAILISLFIFIPACSNNSQTLLVGVEPSIPPFEYADGKGKIIGFDIDLMDAIAKHAHLNIQYYPLLFDEIIPAVESNTIDLAISSIYITPERQQAVSFSNPYFLNADLVLISKEGSNVNSIKELAGQKVASKKGFTGLSFAKTLKDVQVHAFNNLNDMFFSINNDPTLNNAILDRPIVEYYINSGKLKNVKIIEKIADGQYGIIYKKDNSELGAKINKALAEIQKNGEYKRIYDKWFPKKSGTH